MDHMHTSDRRARPSSIVAELYGAPGPQHLCAPSAPSANIAYTSLAVVKGSLPAAFEADEKGFAAALPAGGHAGSTESEEVEDEDEDEEEGSSSIAFAGSSSIRAAIEGLEAEAEEEEEGTVTATRASPTPGRSAGTPDSSGPKRCRFKLGALAAVSAAEDAAKEDRDAVDDDDKEEEDDDDDDEDESMSARLPSDDMARWRRL